MINLKSRTQADFEKVGTEMLDVLNISLFNMEPTHAKAYQIFHVLRENDYINANKEQGMSSIKVFVKTRTKANMQKLFYSLFSISYYPEINQACAMSYRSCIIPDSTIEQVGEKLFVHIEDLDLHKYGVSKQVLDEALKSLYKPKYNENEWKITLKALHGRIRQVLQLQQQVDYLSAINEIFYVIDPTIQNKTYTCDILGEQTQDGTETGYDDEAAIANLDEQRGNSTNEGKKGPADYSSLTSKIKIKEYEARYIREVLARFDNELYPQNLDENLKDVEAVNDYMITANTDKFLTEQYLIKFKKINPDTDESLMKLSKERHIMVTNFHKFVKDYNLYRNCIDPEDPKAINELIMAKQGVLDSGEKLIMQYEALVNNTVRTLNIKMNTEKKV